MKDSAELRLEQEPFGERVADDTIRFIRTFRAPLARVWEAISTPQGLAPWLGEAVVDLQIGGVFNVRLNPDVEMRGRVIALEPPVRLVVLWHEFDEGVVMKHGTMPDSTSELSFELEAAGDRTKLTLVHRFIEGGDVMTSFLGGWHAHLDQLVAQIGGHPLPDRMETYHRMKPLYESDGGARLNTITNKE